MQATINGQQVAAQAQPMVPPKRKQSQSARQPLGASGKVRWQVIIARARNNVICQSAATTKAKAAAAYVCVHSNERSPAATIPRPSHGVK